MSNNPVCKVCKKSIPISAKVCTECSHYQDWRRFLTLGSSSLSLIIALISVIGLTAPTFYELFFREIEFQMLAAREGDVFDVFVRNPTEQVGYVRSVDLFIPPGLRSSRTFEGQEVEGESTWHYRFELSPADVRNLASSNGCSLELSYIVDELALRSASIPVECSG
jgi:hypothetical protein